MSHGWVWKLFTWAKIFRSQKKIKLFMKSTPGFLRNGWKLLQSLIIAHQTEIDKIQKFWCYLPGVDFIKRYKIVFETPKYCWVYYFCVKAATFLVFQIWLWNWKLNFGSRIQILVFGAPKLVLQAPNWCFMKLTQIVKLFLKIDKLISTFL